MIPQLSTQAEIEIVPSPPISQFSHYVPFSFYAKERERERENAHNDLFSWKRPRLPPNVFARLSLHLIL